MTTNNKKPKINKLRNAEYYNFQKIQDNLYEQSKRNIKFKKLIDIITTKENILLAYRNIKKNKGSKTAGTDKLNIEDIGQWDTDNFIKHIRKKFEWYQPQKIKRVEIPKANGKTRPLGIPTIIDRIIQQCILQVLEPICEAKFHERNNGFRPCRSAEHAIAQTYKFIQISKLYYVVDIDIKGFFDNVNHGKLLKQMWTLGIRDKKLICIISAMLKAEIANIGFPEKGTPQGGILSPLLSNIVLNELDWWITSQWEEIKTRRVYKEKISPNGKVQHGNRNKELKKTQLKEIYIVRYADDFKIFCKHKDHANRIFIATKKWLKERLGLDISTEKSKIVNLKKEYSEFLGFKIKASPKGKRNQNTKYVVKSYMSNKAKSKIQKESINKIKEIQKAKDNQEIYDKINKYNSYVMGIHNYYNIATHICKDFSNIAFVVNRNLKNKLKNLKKYSGQTIPTYVLNKYKKSKQIRFYRKQCNITNWIHKNKKTHAQKSKYKQIYT